jgi:multicomponent K+:H+ antiporter subunit E
VIKRLLPHPWLSLLILASWLLLQHSLHPAHLASGAVTGVLIPLLLAGFLPRRGPLRRTGTALRLLGVVLKDIVMSNIVVARIVLNPAARPQPAWVHVPLTVRSPAAINLLASIITMTPGTVSCVVDAERRAIWVHALDCADADALAADIVQRYEAPLLEILG